MQPKWQSCFGIVTLKTWNLKRLAFPPALFFAIVFMRDREGDGGHAQGNLKRIQRVYYKYVKSFLIYKQLQNIWNILKSLGLATPSQPITFYGFISHTFHFKTKESNSWGIKLDNFFTDCNSYLALGFQGFFVKSDVLKDTWTGPDVIIY